jgi:tRNA threonylcarbamoyladenosine biosynthesis protein TsaE
MPILDSRSLEIISRSTDQTRRVGMRLGTLLETGDVVGLEGELGSGKTTLVQGIAAGWGSLDQVSSPTFVLVNIYRRPDGMRLHHLDAYRLDNFKQVLELDIDHMLCHGPLVIEWAERVKEALPPSYIWVNLNWIEDEQRDLLLTAKGGHYEQLLDQLRVRVYGG